MERLADAVEDRVLHRAATRLVELERRVQQQLLCASCSLVMQPGSAAYTAPAPPPPPLPLQEPEPEHGMRPAARWASNSGELVLASDLGKLAAKALDLGDELAPELGVLGLVGRQMLLGLVEGDEGMLDAADELGLVVDFPRLESLEVLEEHGGKVLGELLGHSLEASASRSADAGADLLEVDHELRGGVKQRLLACAHALEDMAVGDHKAGEEDQDVDVLWDELLGRRAVAEHRQQVDALEDILGHSDDGLLAEQDQQRLEAACIRVLVFHLCSYGYCSS